MLRAKKHTPDNDTYSRFFSLVSVIDDRTTAHFLL